MNKGNSYTFYLAKLKCLSPTLFPSLFLPLSFFLSGAGIRKSNGSRANAIKRVGVPFRTRSIRRRAFQSTPRDATKDIRRKCPLPSCAWHFFFKLFFSLLLDSKGFHRLEKWSHKLDIKMKLGDKKAITDKILPKDEC